MRQGLEALAAPSSAGDTISALRWLERAHRLVPIDANVTLTLASAYLAHDPARAATLFQSVAGAHDIRQAWLGLAAAHLRLNCPDDAAGPLAIALSRYAFTPDVACLANMVGQRLGGSGWCGLRSDGHLEIHMAALEHDHAERNVQSTHIMRPNKELERADFALQPEGARALVRVLLDGKAVRGATLPPGWKRSQTIDLQVGDVPLLGSPIQVAAIRRVAGCVEVWEGGIRGWAWHPGDPATAPVLRLLDRSRQLEHSFVACDESVMVPNTGPLARPRSFHLTRSELPDRSGVMHVRGPDGKDLPGSPLDPSLNERADVAEALRLGQLYCPIGKPGASKMTGHEGGMHLLGTGGVPLRAGGPVPAQPAGAGRRKRGTTIVIPVHEGAEAVLPCLDSVLTSVSAETRILVVDDGSSDPVLIAALDNLARRRKITLLRHARALGFPAAANQGIRAARGQDVVLLNSDTLVPPGWLERLREAAYADANIGTVTPLSNDASILSYPGPSGSNPRPDQAAANRLDRLAKRANGRLAVDIPVGIGFCLYLRRDCLNIVGSFRADLFAQGYGEENDLCLRARRLGWRNVALPGLFVGHIGGTSFGGSAVHMRARNSRIVEQLHPGYQALIDEYLARDPLVEPRRRIDLLQWRRRVRPWRRAAILISHNDGGGVEQRLVRASKTHARAGRFPIVLRPAETSSGEPAISVHDGLADDLPNLVYAVPRELSALLHLLRATKPEIIEAHHLADYPPEIYDLVAKLDVPYDVHVHDYAWFCPRISLVGAYDRYCGEPPLHDCEDCIADNGHFLKEDIPVAALLRRSTGFLAAARRVVVPSDDTGVRMRRHFDRLVTVTVPHEDDAAIPMPAISTRGIPMSAIPTRAIPMPAIPTPAIPTPAIPMPVIPMPVIPRAVLSRGLLPGSVLPPAVTTDNVRSGRASVCVVGAIGIHKGYNILLACARDAVRRDLDLQFIIVGHTIDDARMLATGRVFVTGGFEPNEAVDLIAGQNARLGFVASICPETWCLSLGDIWRAGLPAAAFDLGAPAERIRSTGRGILLPLGLSASAINNTLVAVMATAEH